MKYTTASVLITLVAVSAVQSSVIAPSPPLASSEVANSALNSPELDHAASSEVSNPELSSLVIGYGAEELSDPDCALAVSEGLELQAEDAELGIAGARNRLLFRRQYIRSALSNTVHIHNQTWRGSSRITAVRAWQVGANQGATARVTAGGVGATHVTVQMRSALGRGFNIVLEIYGR